MTETAKTDNATRNVVILLFEGVQALDVVGPTDVFAQAEKRSPGSYCLHFLSASSNVRTSSGLVLKAENFNKVSIPSLHTLLIPGGDAFAITSALQNRAFMAWLRLATSDTDRIASICSGAFFLARLGLLDDRRATTHWMALESLSSSAPSANISPDAMFTEDGKIWTSAGIAAGMDLALALVRRDLGADIALSVARDLVIPVTRSTGQLAYAEPKIWANQTSNDLDGLIDYLSKNIANDISVDNMAHAVGLTTRTFHRRCKQVYQITPAEILLNARLEKVRVSLLNSNAPLKEIAARTGYSSEAALSRAFKRQFSISPGAFRAGFSAP